jgi:hypothetical protein
VVPFDVLEYMKEDLLEIITSAVVRGEMADLSLQLCRISTREEEQIMATKF